MNPLAPWSQYFTAEAGAAAALTGLLFVALSFNLERIAADQTWLRRAAAPPAPGFVNSFRNLFARTGHVRLETGVRLLLTLAGSITAAKQDHAPPEATAKPAVTGRNAAPAAARAAARSKTTGAATPAAAGHTGPGPR